MIATQPGPLPQGLLEFLNFPSWQHIDFWIGIVGLIFAFLAFIEAKQAKRAARAAGKVVKVQTVVSDLTEISTRLDRLDPDIQFTEARDFINEVSQVVAHSDRLQQGRPRQNRDSPRVTSASAWMQFLESGSAGTRTRNQRLKRALLYRLSYRPLREKLCKVHRREWQHCRAGAPPANHDSGKRCACPTASKSSVNRAANFVADRTETPVSQPPWLLSNRVLDRHPHG